MGFKAYVIFDHLKWGCFFRGSDHWAGCSGRWVFAVVRGIFRVGSSFGVGFSAGVGGVFVWVGEGAGGWALGYHSMWFRHFPDIS